MQSGDSSSLLICQNPASSVFAVKHYTLMVAESSGSDAGRILVALLPSGLSSDHVHRHGAGPALYRMVTSLQSFWHFSWLSPVYSRLSGPGAAVSHSSPVQIGRCWQLTHCLLAFCRVPQTGWQGGSSAPRFPGAALPSGTP